MKSLKMMLKIC